MGWMPGYQLESNDNCNDARAIRRIYLNHWWLCSIFDFCVYNDMVKLHGLKPMTDERYNFLMRSDEYRLTDEEWKEGWHFCVEWDSLLVGPGMSWGMLRP